jgi:hypothetical protein
MKKLNLRGISEILSEKELKSVVGGSSSGGLGTCAYFDPDGSCQISGVSRGIAEALANVYGGNWCCDSCGSASWNGAYEC